MFGHDCENGKSRTFVLIPGGWCGGWCWKPVTERLEAAGHRAFPVTFTGSGDRAHLLSPEVSLETYVLDILNLIRYNDLSDVVLAAHSMGGAPAVMVLDRIPDSIRHVVFVDSLLPVDGESALDLVPPEEAARRRTLVEQGDGMSLPVPAGVHFASEAVRDWFISHMTPQPLRPYEDRVRLDHAPGNGVPATYLACTPPRLPAVISSAARARRMPGWRYEEIVSGHNVQIHRPDDVAAILIAASRLER